MQEISVSEAIKEECLKLQTTLLQKNHDYGNSALSTPLLRPDMDVQSAIEVRMGDKISRFINLKNKQSEVDESLRDTVRDLAGYCILWLISEVNDGF